MPYWPPVWVGNKHLLCLFIKFCFKAGSKCFVYFCLQNSPSSHFLTFSKCALFSDYTSTTLAPMIPPSSLLLLLLPLSSSTNLVRHELSDPKAICNDGTPASFHRWQNKQEGNTNIKQYV